MAVVSEPAKTLEERWAMRSRLVSLRGNVEGMEGHVQRESMSLPTLSVSTLMVVEEEVVRDAMAFECEVKDCVFGFDLLKSPGRSDLLG